MENQYFDIWQRKRLDSINLLFEKSNFESALELCWTYIKEYIFNFNLNNRISYNSTEEAITNFFFVCKNFKLKTIVHFFYTLNITINWDKEISVDLEKGEYIKKEFFNFLNQKKYLI